MNYLKTSLSLFVCFFFLGLSSPSRSHAAIPIRQEQKTKMEKLNERVEIFQAKYAAKPLSANGSAQSDDEGIYGILSLVMAVLGIFPAAIVLGIIGMQPGRELKGLAVAGLVLGIFEALLFLLFIAFLVWLI